MADLSKITLDSETVLNIKDATARQELLTKLTMVSSMPSTPSSGQVVLYLGATTTDLTQGGIYMYDSTEAQWVLISSANVDSIPTATVASYFD